MKPFPGSTASGSSGRFVTCHLPLISGALAGYKPAPHEKGYDHGRLTALLSGISNVRRTACMMDNRLIGILAMGRRSGAGSKLQDIKRKVDR
jgi:hypothetical protein